MGDTLQYEACVARRLTPNGGDSYCGGGGGGGGGREVERTDGKSEEKAMVRMLND